MRLIKNDKPTEILYTLSYSEQYDRYLLDKDKVMLQDIPPEAVHVTGEAHAHLLDTTGLWAPPDPERMTAVDLNLWMVNNDINNALAALGTPLKVDFKKLVVYGFVAIIAICIVWAMM